MNTTNMDNLRQFYSVVNRQHLNKDVYNFLLKRWDLEDVDLELEADRIKNKISKLSKSKRDAVKEFLILKNILKEVEKTKNLSETKEAEEELNFN